MPCTTGALCAVLLSLSAPAPAPDHRIVVQASDPFDAHQKAVVAAEKVCTAARSNDPFGDFGTQEECIENTLSSARIVHMGYSRTALVTNP
jgi:hypothetical protein